MCRTFYKDYIYYSTTSSSLRTDPSAKLQGWIDPMCSMRVYPITVPPFPKPQRQIKKRKGIAGHHKRKTSKYRIGLGGSTQSTISNLSLLNASETATGAEWTRRIEGKTRTKEKPENIQPISKKEEKHPWSGQLSGCQHHSKSKCLVLTALLGRGLLIALLTELSKQWLGLSGTVEMAC